ncbi:phage tail tube protein [Trueperella bialowiezensis]|uniref:Phage tail protein n=1 Tax=Trueperella bialowiezensis TaxID=312285 RepID=A0A3S4V6Q1_9ACTO|nr:phage tail protein [Trueperella bialowiezensis]VEI13214.1 Uncharacterised protein [Trueperella bialowiezensis]
MALPEIMIGAPLTAGGAFAVAPVGTALPTDATSDLNPAFKTLGLIGEDGFTLTQNRSTNDIKVWGGATKRRLTNEFSETVGATFMESAAAETLKAIFGEDNVQVAGKKISIAHTSDGSAEQSYVITMKDGDARRRLVIPRGQLFLTSQIQYVHSDAIKYDVEITCYEDEDGRTSLEYVDDTAA